jgi:hypothetical protein
MVGWTPWGLLVWVLGTCSVQDKPAERFELPVTASVARRQSEFEVPAVRFVRAKATEVRQVRGDPSWRHGKPAKPGELEVHVSLNAAQAGEPVTVTVSTPGAADLRVEVFRQGFYGGAGALKVWDGGVRQAATAAPCPRVKDVAVRPCPVQETFSFAVGEQWAPGLYLVKVTRADGVRSLRPLLVKARPAATPQT